MIYTKYLSIWHHWTSTSSSQKETIVANKEGISYIGYHVGSSGTSDQRPALNGKQDYYKHNNCTVLEEKNIQLRMFF